MAGLRGKTASPCRPTGKAEKYEQFRGHCLLPIGVLLRRLPLRLLVELL
jgi:hypothetical protein